MSLTDEQIREEEARLRAERAADDPTRVSAEMILEAEPEPSEDAAHTPVQAQVHTPPDNRATVQPPASGPPDLAYDQRILDRFADEVRLRGLVGEEATAKVLYLVITSRLFDKQVSAGVKGHSSSGKSFVVETVTRFFPPEAYLEFTAMSERALVYSPEQFSHRTMVLYEVVALREGVEDNLTSYFVRSLLSEGRIDYEVTVRDPEAGFTTRRIVKEGPTNLIFTTTKTRVHAENETRVLSLNTDDSPDQTRRVLLELADDSRDEDDLVEWRTFQAWLTGAEKRATIPYARELAEQVPPVAVRLRRDFSAVLALIRAHAVLHQVNRARDEHGRVVANLDDYDVVRTLVAPVVAQGVGSTVSEIVRESVATVNASAPAEGITARAVADKLGLDKSTMSRRLRVAADGGYLRNLENKRGRPGRWVVGDPMPEDADLLPQPHNLTVIAMNDETPRQSRIEPSGCAVARESGGGKDAGLSEPHTETDGHMGYRICPDCGGKVHSAVGSAHRCEATA